MDQVTEKVKTYQERVATFMSQVRGWCASRGLEVRGVQHQLIEQALPVYQAAGLDILVAGNRHLASLLPTGSAIIGAQGRIELKGTLARHALLYQIGQGPTFSVDTISEDGSVMRGASRPMISGVDGDGWYWYEASVRRATRVDERLFVDLITDVSDYEF